MNILNQQKQKKVVIKKEFNLTSDGPDGLKSIKEILGKIEDKGNKFELRYLSAGRYLIKTVGSDAKKLDHALQETLQEIEKKAKKSGMTFSLKEK